MISNKQLIGMFSAVIAVNLVFWAAIVGVILAGLAVAGVI